MSYASAAMMPLILSTAWFALDHTARLGKGKTVLIHAAAGGVRQMAVQIAQRAGARILATVGSTAKRQLLKDVYDLGDDSIFSSRDASFARGVMEATGGRGVNVVLNSLAGPLLHASWACLAPFGRFVEIGKRDIHENGKIAMDPFRRNMLFASVDLVTMFERNEALGAKLFRECCDLMARGEVRSPATIKEVAYADVIHGFRLLQKSQHTGKIVLVLRADDMLPVMPSVYRHARLFEPSKCYLLVGGLGGLGRTLSQWMVRKGSRKLAFLSRSGADKAETRATVDWLGERGIEVTVYRGDMARRADVEACVAGLGPELGGVFQAAMVLQDRPLETMTYEQWQRCCRPKVEGTRNLHEATADLDLDFFICFSSLTAIAGSKGQANYSAANCFFDALMRHRRGLGLRGTMMNVGAVTGVGVVAENEELHRVMVRMGMDTINEDELLFQLEEAVMAERTAPALTARGCASHQIISGVGLISGDVYWAGKPLMKNLYSNHEFGSSAAGPASKNLLAQLSKGQWQGPAPLSTFQSRLWFMHSFLEDKSQLNLPIVLRIRGRSDRETLAKALQEMGARNPALRTAYFEGDDYAVQQPVEGLELGLDYQDLSGTVDGEAALQELVRQSRRLALDIEAGEVARYTLAKLGEDTWALVGMTHHISIDRASLFPMMTQFVAVYDALRSGQDLATVVAPEFSYVDFTLWHRARLASELMNPDLDWWRARLEGLPEASRLLPFAKGSRPARGDPERRKVRANLDGKLFARMKRVAAQAGGTPFHFVLAAFRALLYRYTEEDVVLLVVDGNRPHPDTDRLMGFFVNLALVRCNDDCDVAFDQLLQATKRRALEAMAHSGVPFDTIVDMTRRAQTSSQLPVGQIAVNYQVHGPVPAYATADFVVEDTQSDDVPTAANLQLEALEMSEHSLDLKMEYATALYGDADMERFLDNFVTLLASCIRDHRQPVTELAMCGPLELAHQRARFWGAGVLDVIGRRARRAPEATAVRTDGGAGLKYARFMAQAESVAGVLEAAGARPGDRVGLVALPGAEAVVGMLDALMTGAGYVALDQDFACDRLAFMVADSNARLLLAGPGPGGRWR